MSKAILDANNRTILKIYNDEFMDANNRTIAKLYGQDVLDSNNRKISTVSDIKREIDGSLGGRTVVAFWLAFIK